jgi:hypothetical protein
MAMNSTPVSGPAAVHLLQRAFLQLSTFWRIQIIAWPAFAMVTFPLKFGIFESWAHVIAATLYREPLGLLLTCCLRLAFKRQSINSTQPLRLGLKVLSLSMLAGAIDIITYWLIFNHGLKIDSSQSALGLFCYRSLLYCVWSFLYFWIGDQMKARKRLLDLMRAEMAARDAEILMLRAQVTPHFLFNAFNAILADLERRPQSLVPVVQGLSDYFRYTLSTRHETLVPLGIEFDAMVNYLTVEKARFRDSLVVETHIDPSVRGLPVPGIFLQPLVENALKFGHLTSTTPLHVGLRVTGAADGGARIEVTNSGHWLTPTENREAHQTGGCGLSNLRKRLILSYGNENLLQVPTRYAQGDVMVHLSLPRPIL